MGRARAGTRVAVVVVMVAMAATSTAAAQVAGPTMDDGTYTGTISVSGSFGFGIEQDATTGRITWSGSGSGPATLVIEEGRASGDWAMSGSGTIDGVFSGPAGDITIDGVQDVLEGRGSFTGAGGAYRLVGTSDSRVTASVTVPGLGTQSSTQTSSDPVDAPLHDLLFACNHLVGRYDHDVKQDLDAIGFDESLVGAITLVREPHSDETEQALQDLTATLGEALRDIHSSDWLAQLEGVGRLAEVIQGAAEVAQTLNEPSPCPASDQHYLELAADIARQATEALLAVQAAGELDVPTSVLFDAVIAMAATGLAGTPEGQALMDSVQAIIEQRWTELGADPGRDGDRDPEIVEIVVMSATMFWELPLADGSRMPAHDLLGGGA